MFLWALPRRHSKDSSGCPFVPSTVFQDHFALTFVIFNSTYKVCLTLSSLVFTAFSSCSHSSAETFNFFYLFPSFRKSLVSFKPKEGCSGRIKDNYNTNLLPYNWKMRNAVLIFKCHTAYDHVSTQQEISWHFKLLVYLVGLKPSTTNNLMTTRNSKHIQRVYFKPVKEKHDSDQHET